ncbi:hypothetical protein MMPV_003819 [Pyropia vietnamensis]
MASTPAGSGPAQTLVTLRDLPASRHATLPAATVYAPADRRGPPRRPSAVSHLEVYKYTERIAGTLRTAGVRPGTVVAVVSPPCLEAVCFFLAAQWVGAVAAPLPPSLGADALATALTAVGARAVACRPEEPVPTAAVEAADAVGVLVWHLTQSLNGGVGLEVLERFVGEGAAWKGGAGDFTIDPDEVAVHLLTGWASDDDADNDGEEDGAPQAADPDAPLAAGATVLRLTHAMVAAAAVSFSSVYGLSTEDVSVWGAGLHDADGVVTLIATIYSGGHLIIPPPPVGDDVSSSAPPPPTVAALASTHSASWLSLPPSAAASVLAAPPIAELRHVRVTSPSARSAAAAPSALPAWCPPEAVGVGALVAPADPTGGLRAAPGLEIAAVTRGEDGEWCRAPPGESGVLAVRGASVAAARMPAGSDSAAAASAAPFVLTEEVSVVTSGPVSGASSDAGEGYEAGGSRASDFSDGGSGVGVGATSSGPAVEGPGRRPLATRLWMPTADRGSIDAAGVVCVDVAASRREVAAAAAVAEAARAAQEQQEKELASKAAAAAAAAAAASAAAAAAAKAQAEADAEEAAERAKEEAAAQRAEEEQAAAAAAAKRSSPLGIEAEEGLGLDSATAAAILGRLEAIESNHAALEAELVAAHNAELADLNRRLREAESAASAAALAADRSAVGATSTTVATTVPTEPVVMDVRMDAVEACAMAAAASAEDAHQQTAAAVAAAKSIAESAFGLTIDAGGQMRLAPGGGAVGAAAAAASRSVPSAGGLLVGNTGEQTGLVKRVEVSLGEVEAALRSHPAVADARAFGRTDARSGGADVHVAFVTLPGARVSEPWLRLHAQSMLPSTMVPRKFYQVDALPADVSRAALAASTGLRDMSGYTGVNAAHLHVKQPAWRPAIKAPKKVSAG